MDTALCPAVSRPQRETLGKLGVSASAPWTERERHKDRLCQQPIFYIVHYTNPSLNSECEIYALYISAANIPTTE